MTESNCKTDEWNEISMIPPELSGSITRELDELVGERERILQKTRKITQFSSKIINDIHNSKSDPGHVEELREMVRELNEITAGHPRITYAPYVDSALGEYCEAMIFLALVNGLKIPIPGELTVDSVPYLLGMGDVVGELRRYILRCMKCGEIERAKIFYHRMEKVYDFLSPFHYPKAVVDVRRKRDVARSLLEKTLGELVVTAGNMELSRKMDRMNEAKGE